MIDHLSAALERLPEKSRQPNIEALLAILVAPIQEVEDAISDFVARLPLGVAVGSWLDLYGKLLDLERRAGWTDDQFRFYLQTKILALSSSGTAPDIVAVARRMAPDGTDPALTQIRMEYPKAYRLTIPDVPASVQGLAAELVGIATSATMRGVVVFYDSSGSFAFRAPGATHGFSNGVFGHAVAVAGTE